MYIYIYILECLGQGLQSKVVSVPGRNTAPAGILAILCLLARLVLSARLRSLKICFLPHLKHQFKGCKRVLLFLARLRQMFVAVAPHLGGHRFTPVGFARCWKEAASQQWPRLTSTLRAMASNLIVIAWAIFSLKGSVFKVDRPHASHVAACDAKEHGPFYGRVLRHDAGRLDHWHRCQHASDAWDQVWLWTGFLWGL